MRDAIGKYISLLLRFAGANANNASVHREEVIRVRNYEAMYILKPTLEDEAIDAAITRFEDVVKNHGGENVKIDRWGKRRLAYEVDGINEGFYVLMNFTSESATAQELERLLKINDNIVRHLVLRSETE